MHLWKDKQWCPRANVLEQLLQLVPVEVNEGLRYRWVHVQGTGLVNPCHTQSIHMFTPGSCSTCTLDISDVTAINLNTGGHLGQISEWSQKIQSCMERTIEHIDLVWECATMYNQTSIQHPQPTPLVIHYPCHYNQFAVATYVQWIHLSPKTCCYIETVVASSAVYRGLTVQWIIINLL